MSQRSARRASSELVAAIGLGALLVAGHPGAAWASPAATDEAPTDQASPGQAPPEDSADGEDGGDTGRGANTSDRGAPAYPWPDPPSKKKLPEEVDAAPGWQFNITCDPVLRPGVEAFGNLVGKHYEMPAYSTFRSCLPRQSEHYDGRGLDWSMNAYDPRQKAVGDSVAAWLTENDGEMARRFGIQSIIWNQQSWYTYASEQGWQAYTGPSPHTDHLHFSFTWDGAMMRTSWWTGVPVDEPDEGPCRAFKGQYAVHHVGARSEPCPTDLPAPPATEYGDVVPGDQGKSVRMAQEALEVDVTGVLDEETLDALLAWQEKQEVPVTGVLDQATWAAMTGQPVPEPAEGAEAVPIPDWLTTRYTAHKDIELVEEDRGKAVKVLQQAIDVEVDGVFGPVTAEALEEFTESHKLLRGGAATTPLVWQLLERRDHPTLPYRTLTVERDDEGRDAEERDDEERDDEGRDDLVPVVKVIQEHLGVETDGVFGPITEQAVIEVQAEAGLEETGVVAGHTWPALEKWAAAQEAEEKDSED